MSRRIEGVFQNKGEGNYAETQSCSTCAYFVPDKKKPEKGLCFGNKVRAKQSCKQWKEKKCTVTPK
jgi:hypothetical protein